MTERWWEAAPLADDAEAPAAMDPDRWWEAAPLAEDEDDSGKWWLSAPLADPEAEAERLAAEEAAAAEARASTDTPFLRRPQDMPAEERAPRIDYDAMERAEIAAQAENQRRWDEQSFLDRNIVNPLKTGWNSLASAFQTMSAADLVRQKQAFDELERLNAEGDPAKVKAYLAQLKAEGNDIGGEWQALQLSNQEKAASAKDVYASRIEGGLNESIEGIARNQKANAELPQDAAVARAREANSLSEFAKVIYDNPATIWRFTAESAPQMLPSLAGAPIGPVGIGIGSFYGQQGSAMLESLTATGVDAKDPKALRAAFENPETMQKARDYAVKYGLPVALLDAMSGGVAGKMIAPATIGGRTLSGGAREGLNLAAQAPLQGAMGAAGEYAGQSNAKDGDVNLVDVAIEGVAGFGTTPIEIGALAGKRVYKNLTSGSEPARPPITPPTAEDEASPIPTEMIQRGKQAVADRLAGIEPAPVAEEQAVEPAAKDGPEAPPLAEGYEPLFNEAGDVIGSFNAKTGDVKRAAPAEAEPGLTAESYVDDYLAGKGRGDTEADRDYQQFAANNADAIEAEFQRRRAEPAAAPAAEWWANDPIIEDAPAVAAQQPLVDEPAPAVTAAPAPEMATQRAAEPVARRQLPDGKIDARVGDVVAVTGRKGKYQVGYATKVDDDGIVTEMRLVDGAVQPIPYSKRVSVVPAERLDMAAVDTQLRQNDRFGERAEMQEALRPFIRQEGAPAPAATTTPATIEPLNKTTSVIRGDVDVARLTEALGRKPLFNQTAQAYVIPTAKVEQVRAALPDVFGPVETGAVETPSAATTTAAKPIADLTADDVAPRFAAAKTSDEYDNVRMELWSARPDLQNSIVAALDNVPRPPEPVDEAEVAQAAAADAVRVEKARQVADYVASGGKVTFRTYTKIVPISDPRTIRVGTNGLYVSRGKNWDYLIDSQLDTLVSQIPKSRRTQPGAAPAPDVANPAIIKQPDQPVTSTFDPTTKLPEARAYVGAGKSVKIPAVAKALGLGEMDARRVMTALAQEQGSGVRINNKGEPARIPTSTRPKDLRRFAAEMGGIRDDEGHDLKKGRNLQRFVPKAGPLIRENGNSLDRIGEAAHEAGYFRERPTVDEVLQALERDNFYVPEEGAAFAAEREAKDDEQTTKQRREDIKSVAKAKGELLKTSDIDAIAASMASTDMDADEAVSEYVYDLTMRAANALEADTGDTRYDDQTLFDDIPFDEGQAEPRPGDRDDGARGEGRAREARDAPDGGARGADAAQDRGPLTDTVQTVDGAREQGRMFTGAEDRATPPKVQARAPQRAADEGLFGARDEAVDDEPPLFSRPGLEAPEGIERVPGQNRNTPQAEPEGNIGPNEDEGNVPLFKRPDAALTETFTSQADAVYQDLRVEMDRVGLGKVDLRVENSIFSNGKTISFSARPDTDQIDGFFWRNTIGVALDAVAGASFTLNHEIIHGLRSSSLWKSDYGLFRRAEWDTLERAARADRGRMREVRNRYADLTEAQQVEEAIADMYADWMAGRMEARGFIRTAFERIKAFFEALGNALRGNGFQTADDVFGRIDSGEIGARQDGAMGEGGDVQFSRREYGIPQEAGRPVVTFVGEGPMKRHADYAAAKSGDVEAAARLVIDLVIPQQFAQARSRFGKDVTYVPVIAEEATGRNFIPPALARLYAEKTGAAWTDQVVQTNRVYHTGARAMPRMVRRAEFVGRVEAGKRYVLVDDMAALGGTFAELANHIRSNGGEVVGLVLLATHKNSEQYAANPSTVAKLEGKFGDIIREELDYEPAALTGPEAEHLNSFDSADRLRDRISEARRQGDSGGSGSASGETGEVSPQFSRRDNDLFRGNYGAPQRNVAESLLKDTTGFLQKLSTDGRQALGESFDRWRYAFQDRFVDLKRIQGEIATTLGRSLRAGENPYQAEELMTGKVGARMERLSEDMVAPLVQAIATRLGDKSVTIGNETLSGIALVDKYLYARHAPERNARIAEINPKFKPGEGSGMTDAEAVRVMDAIRRAGLMSDVETVAKQIDAMIEFSVQTRQDAGLLSKEQADAWRAQYRHYVPLRGFAELDPELENERPNLGGSGLTVKGAESKRAFGRTSKAADIVAHVISQAQEAIVRAERNEVGRALFNLVSQMPNPDLWEANKVDMRPTWNEKSQQVEYRPVTPIFGADADYTVTLKIDGKEHRVTFNRDNAKARRLADSFRNLSGQDFAWIVRNVGWVNRFLSKVNTSYNPAFVITNAFRDIQTGLINLAQYDMPGLVAGTARDYFPAMKASMQASFGKERGEWGRWYREYVDAGGRVYFNQVDSIKDLQAKLQRDLQAATTGPGLRKALHTVGNFVERGNQGIEGAIRLAAYKNARERGMSKTDAASLAKNLTVNFNRRGKYGPVMNSLFLFFNAGIQGTATMLGAMKSPRVRKILAGIAGFAATLTVYNLMAGGDDDDGERFYDKIPEFEKERNLIIMMPDGSGRYAKIPLPYGYNLFHGLGRNATELVWGKEPSEVVASIATTFVGSFNPIGGSNNIMNFIAPTIADPIVDLERNRNFADAPIRREQDKYEVPVPDAQLYWPSVSPLAKWVTDFLTEITGGDDVVAGAIDVSPETVEYLWGTVTGAAGSFWGDKVIGTVMKFSDPTADVEINDIPFARNIVGAKSEWVDRTAFYDRSAKIDLVVDQIDKYRESGRAEKAAELRREHAPILPLAGLAKSTKRTLSDIRKRRAEMLVRKDEGKILPLDYKAEIDRLKEQEKRAETRFNAAWNAAKKGQ